MLANERAQLARSRKLAWLHYIQIVFCELIEWLICFAKLYTSMKPASHQVEWLRFGIIVESPWSHLIILVNDNTEPENVHSSHIQLFNLGDSQNQFGMMDRCETFRDCRASIPFYHPRKFHTCILFPVVFMKL